MQSTEMSVKSKIPEEQVKEGIARDIHTKCANLLKNGQIVEASVPVDPYGYSVQPGEYLKLVKTIIGADGKPVTVEIRTSPQLLDEECGLQPDPGNLTNFIGFKPDETLVLPKDNSPYIVKGSIEEANLSCRRIEHTPPTTKEILHYSHLVARVEDKVTEK